MHSDIKKPLICELFQPKVVNLVRKTRSCLKATSQELVFHLQVVPLVHLSLERLIQNSIAGVVLNVLPTSVAVSEAEPRSRKTNGSAEPHKILQIRKQRWVCGRHGFISLLTVCKYHSSDCSSLPSGVITLLFQMLSSSPLTSGGRIRDDASQQPVVMATVPDVMHLSRRQRRPLLSLPEGVQL